MYAGDNTDRIARVNDTKTVPLGPGWIYDPATIHAPAIDPGSEGGQYWQYVSGGKWSGATVATAYVGGNTKSPQQWRIYQCPLDPPPNTANPHSIFANRRMNFSSYVMNCGVNNYDRIPNGESQKLAAFRSTDYLLGKLIRRVRLPAATRSRMGPPQDLKASERFMAARGPR